MSSLLQTELRSSAQPDFGSVKLTVYKTNPISRPLLEDWSRTYTNAHSMAAVDSPTTHPGKSILHIVSSPANEQSTYEALKNYVIHYPEVLGKHDLELHEPHHEAHAMKDSPPFVKTLRARLHHEQSLNHLA